MKVLLLLALAHAGLVKTPRVSAPLSPAPRAAGAHAPRPAALAATTLVQGNLALAPSVVVAPAVAEEARDFAPLPLPPAPDFAELDSRVRWLPPEPTGWIGKLLHSWKVDAARKARVTTEEEGFKESLVTARDMLEQGAPQEALDVIEGHFTGHRGWFAQHEEFSGYYEAATEYRRHIEERLEVAHARARQRGKSATLAAEAKRAGVWKPTPLQEKDSGHCAYHALHHALELKGTIKELVERTRAKLNAVVQPHLGGRVDLGDGLSTNHLVLVAESLGARVEARGPPDSPEQVRGWLAAGRKILLSLRLFHHKHGDRILHHQVHLLGAYPSETLGAWVYVVQDSGTGTTDLYTWRELKELTREAQLITP